MKKLLLIIFGFLNIVSISNSQTIINGGDVFGKWEKSKSPYYINGNILIPNQKTLTIEPGVKVLFNGHYSLTIKGSLQAIGSKQDSISFTVSDTSLRWNSIRIEDVEQSNDTTRLVYCIIERSHASSGMLPNAYGPGDVGGGIYSSYSRLLVANSIIRNNSAFHVGGLCSNMSAKVINTKIVNNSAVEIGGLNIGQNSKVIGCLISRNSANKYGGIAIGIENILFANNTVCFNTSKEENRCAVFFEGRAEIVNNIFYYNTPNYIAVGDGYGSPRFLFNNIEKGIEGIVDYKPTIEGFFDGTFENNIELPPVFVDTSKNDFRLKESPCINSGDPAFNDPNLQIDIDGNPRIFNDGQNRIDIGAYEYIGATPNRRPFIHKIDEKYFIRNTNNIVSQNYFDVDKDDTHTITVFAKDDNVDVGYSVDEVNKSIATSIKPKFNWTGDFYLFTNINDNSNSINFNFTDSVKVNISRKFKGRIENNIVFKDTVEVIDDIVVMGKGTLTINPGTYVEFQDRYVLNVFGQLKIMGTIDKRIILNAKDSSYFFWTPNDIFSRVKKGWGGIIIQKLNPKDTIQINYCSIKNTGQSSTVMYSYEYYPGTLTIRNSNNIAINNCVFDNNSPIEQNSGITVYNSDLISLKKCRFTNGFSSHFSGAYIHAEYSKLSIDSCVFENCLSRSSLIDGKDISIRNSIFSYNKCHYLINSSNFILENSSIFNNNGGVYFGSNCIIRNNYFVHNYNYESCMAALEIVVGKFAYITNNVFAYNDHMNHSSNFLASSIFTRINSIIANNTFVGNKTDSNGNCVYADYCTPKIINNVFWNNNNEGFGWYNGAGLGIPNPIVKNNLIRGGYNRIGGSNNIDTDPLFRMNDSLDFVLTNVSPCINMGLTDTVGLHLGNIDLVGNNRIDSFYGKIDMGAIEYTGIDVPTSLPSVLPNSTNFNVFPNPAQSSIYIPKEFNSLEYHIINLKSVMVKSEYIRDGFINIEDLPDGFYVIRIKNNNKFYSASFIKQ